MSSHEVLEGKLVQVTEKKNITTKAGKETTVQNIVMYVTEIEKQVKIAIWGHKEDWSNYSGKTVRILALRENTDGSYAGYYGTEIDDMIDSDPLDEMSRGPAPIKTNKSLKEIMTGTKDFIPPPQKSPRLIVNEQAAINASSSELSQFTVTVTRSKDYQSITVTEEFTGSFSEIDSYWADLNKKALLLLEKMTKL